MNWVVEIGTIIAHVFMQPFIYLFFLFILMSGYFRIKKDRRNFRAKVYPYFYEARRTWLVAVTAGIVLSALAIGFGLVLSLPFALVLGAVMFIVAIGNRFTWLSASYPLAITAAVIYFAGIYLQDYIPSSWQPLLDATNLFYVPFLIGVLLFVETWLLGRVRSKDTFPELIKSGRGKYLGQHRLKKLAIIPFVTLIPGGWLEPFNGWPLLDIGGESYGLLVVPYLLGFEYIVKARLATDASKWLAKGHAVLAIVVLLIAGASYKMPMLTVVALVVAFIGKEVILLIFQSKEKGRTPHFQPSEKGLLVLGVMPDTPAVDLELVPGEKIVKVNDIKVNNEEEFYQAVNQNRAFCKLAVEDLQGEVRFAQRSLYEDDHYKLGILFVKEQEPYVLEQIAEKQEG
ncbi:PDZ domain-containing protein [Gracilibacillus sp. S3-1-1]|uniref:PDZ domain-containing protein n=1 Tax=Gracilibacillus pellucidus TaxID=3095368 RepID=A0ACC6M142_9BACI|nr:PDZ domain-containing protein [Gracilibacillus sp. S3-1-1]MDX8044650.1 PDZ domain-containing protein [Gracilibacillus sp. S3-1-1]